MPHNHSNCDWCGKATKNIQIKGGRDTKLCPTCCPDVDEDEMPDNAPPQWNFMTESEKDAWRDGLSMSEIREKFRWIDNP